MSRQQYLPLVQQYAAQYGIPLWLAEAQIQQESGWNPNARSPAGAGGIMQFMPGTGADYGLSPIDRFAPEKAIPAGMKHMRDLLDMFGGDERLALAAYNAGQGAVKKHGGVPPYKETQDYVERIMRARPTDPRMASLDGGGPAIDPNTLPDRAMQPQDPTGLGLHPLVAQMQAQGRPADEDRWLRAAAGIFSAPTDKPLQWLGAGLAGYVGPQGNKLDMLEGLQTSNELYKLEEARRTAGLKRQQAQTQSAAKQRLVEALRLQGRDQEADAMEADMLTSADTGDLLGIQGPADAPTYGVSQNPIEIGAWDDGTPKYGVVRLATDGTMKIEELPRGAQPVSAMPQDPTRQRQLAEEKAAGATTGKTVAEAELSFPQYEFESQQAVGVIDALLSDKEGMQRAVGWTSMLPTIPGGKAADYEARLDQLYGKNFLQAFESLKGGGQITEVEGTKAQQAIIALSTSQSVAAHEAALRELRGIIQKGYERARQKSAPDAPSIFAPRPAPDPDPSPTNPAGLPPNDPLGIR